VDIDDVVGDQWPRTQPPHACAHTHIEHFQILLVKVRVDSRAGAVVELKS
jgi:hypothetical protein